MLAKFDGKGIGGSDVSAIAGLSRYRAPIDIWRRIVEGYETEQTQPMRRGIALEPAIRQLAQEEYGLELLGPRRIQDGWRRASLDDVAKVDGLEEVVEYKSASLRTLADWGEEGSDQVPTEYLLQVQWYLHMLRAPRAQLVVLLGGDELRRYLIRPDLELQSMLFETAEKFWNEHILTKIPPPIDGSSSCTDWLKSRYKSGGGPMRPADLRVEGLAADLRRAKERLKDAETEEARVRNLLVDFIGDADGIEGQGWKITYRQNKGRAVTNWSAVAEEAQIDKGLIEHHTTRSPYRVFRLSGEKE